MNVKIRAASDKSTFFWDSIIISRPCRLRARPPHRVCVGYIHQPQAGVDVTKIPRLELLDAAVTPIIRVRFSYVDDDGRGEEETPDNTTTDDEDDHTDEEKIKHKFHSCMRRERRRSRRRRTTRPTLRTRERPKSTHKTPTGKEKATKTLTATLPTTACHKTNWKANWSHGSTSLFKQPTRQMTCRQQMESRRESSDRAGSVGNK